MSTAFVLNVLPVYMLGLGGGGALEEQWVRPAGITRGAGNIKDCLPLLVCRDDWRMPGIGRLSKICERDVAARLEEEPGCLLGMGEGRRGVSFCLVTLLRYRRRNPWSRSKHGAIIYRCARQPVEGFRHQHRTNHLNLDGGPQYLVRAHELMNDIHFSQPPPCK